MKKKNSRFLNHLKQMQLMMENKIKIPHKNYDKLKPN